MSKSPEADRLNALRQLNLLDTGASESFDRITRMASQIFGLPIAAVSLTDQDRQWFKSRVGVAHDSIPREAAPCAEVAVTRDLLVIPDLSADACYSASHLAQSGVQFYAGAPLVTRDGYGLGALCVLGTEPRTASPQELSALTDLAAMVMSQIELQHAFGRVDAVSGLPNRNQFLDDLADLGPDRAGEERLAVLIDLAQATQLTNFSRVLGPTKVDEMVREAALLVSAALGPGRVAYHVSATQFAFLGYPGAILSEYVQLLHFVLSKIRTESSVQFLMTGVIGVAPIVLGNTAPADVLRFIQGAAADARTNAVPVAIYNPTAEAAHFRQFELLDAFKYALESADQLRLVFQPRIELKTRRCVGAEALLRWRHPTLGIISPGEFVPIIEHSPHAHAMTNWVVTKAAGQLKTWQAGGMDIHLSVNISASNLDDPSFVDRVLSIVSGNAVRPGCIELEVTESAVMRDAGTSLARLNALADAGMTLAIDDFGTGYSSLAYLQKLPAHVVKIDQSFILGLEHSERDQSLVRAMVSISHELGYRVVAEGVETTAAADLLESMGCEEAQGYFFAKPMETSELEDWLSGEQSGGFEPIAA